MPSFICTYMLNGAPVSTFCSGDGSGTACPCGNNGATGSGGKDGVVPGGARGDEGEVLVQFEDSLPRFPAGLTPSGEFLVFETQGTAETAQDVHYWSRSDRVEHGLARTSAGENYSALSPDGAWIAYVTDESGVREVYVQAFPERRGRWQVSEGGSCPVWSRDGRELFYVDGRKIRVVSVSTQPSFSHGPSRIVAELDFIPSSESLADYDVGPDGRLLVVRSTSSASFDGHVNVVLGWGAELRRAGER